MAAEPYPYSGQEVAAFFRRHASFSVGYLKVERSLEDFGHYLCELLVQAGPERLFLQAIQFFGNRFRWPAHLEAVPAQTRVILERQIIEHLLRHRVIESPLSETALAYTGERIIPATAPFHAYWAHARRYAFAARRLRGLRVLDAGCGSGYGTRILAQEASFCLGVDASGEAISLAASCFAKPGVEFRVSDVCSLEGVETGSFDAVVALEVLEHLPGDRIGSFLEAVQRVLREEAVFIVSVANRNHPPGEVNPYHLSEMTFEEFRALLDRSFPTASIQTFGQGVWEGSYRLERECRIVPVRGGTDHPVYLASVELAGPGQAKPVPRGADPKRNEDRHRR